MSWHNNSENRAKIEAFDKMKKLWSDHWNKKKTVAQYGGTVPFDEDLRKMKEIVAILEVESDMMIAQKRQMDIDDGPYDSK